MSLEGLLLLRPFLHLTMWKLRRHTFSMADSANEKKNNFKNQNEKSEKVRNCQKINFEIFLKNNRQKRSALAPGTMGIMDANADLF